MITNILFPLAMTGLLEHRTPRKCIKNLEFYAWSVAVTHDNEYFIFGGAGSDCTIKI